MKYAGMTEPVLSWYRASARMLPWREDPTPYHIWVSEIMLQQTRIEAVKGYYARFLSRLPDVSALASADEETYLKLWEWDSGDYLFPTNDGQQMRVTCLEGSVRRYNISRGVTKTSLHLFRHTFAKNYILAGGGMVQLQSILGHSTLDMTKKYVHLYGKDIQRDFDLLNPLNNIMAARKVEHSGKPKKK